MSNNYFEKLAQTVVEQSAHDKRAQPWKSAVKAEATQPPADGEWYEVNEHRATDNHGSAIDVRKHAFPMKEVDVRTNAFPMGEVSILTHVFPMGKHCMRANEAPI